MNMSEGRREASKPNNKPFQLFIIHIHNFEKEQRNSQKHFNY